MIFLSLIILIMCKALINDKLSEDFYLRISTIILLFSAILSYNCLFINVLGGCEAADAHIATPLTTTLNYNIDLNSGLGIYNVLFHESISLLASSSQGLLEIFTSLKGELIILS